MTYFIGSTAVTIDQYAAHDPVVMAALQAARNLEFSPADVDAAVQYAESLLTVDEFISVVGADAAATVDRYMALAA